MVNDWRVLTTQIEDKLSNAERNKFDEALHILTRWKEVNTVNIKQL